MHNMLLKKYTNSPRHHRLRIIYIIEEDNNLAAKIIWSRRAMRSAEKEKLLSDSNWGSRKGRCAHDMATMKQLHYDITHLRLNDDAYMENDAKL